MNFTKNRRFIALMLGLIFLCATLLPYAVAEVGPTDRVPQTSEWKVKRHEAMKARINQGDADLLMIGDSITQGWEGGGKEVWDIFYADRKAVNLGTSGDKTYDVLWRLEDLDLTKVSPKLAVIMIGTNNRDLHDSAQIAEGVTEIVKVLRTELPDMKILLLGIFPRGKTPGEAFRIKMAGANEILKNSDDGKEVFYLDIGEEYLDADGLLPESVMPDALHPNTKGYWIWARTMEPAISRLLGEMSPATPPKGYKAQFNGKDLKGWKGVMKPPLDNPIKRAALSKEEYKAEQEKADALMNEHWHVENGELIYDGKGFSLATARDYGDFEMIVDWKIPPKGDSGIYLRGAPQVQIWDPAVWPEGSGAFYNNKTHPRNPDVCADNPIGEWNTFYIRMIGERVTVYLNNTLVVNDVVLENFWNYDIPIFSSEQIELQHHGSGLWFKNIYLRDISWEVKN